MEQPRRTFFDAVRLSLRDWCILAASVLGVVFCVAAGLGWEALCVTSGCSLWGDFSLAGISLYWVGGAVFALVAGLVLTGRAQFATLVIWLVVVLDIALLALMAVTAPCTNCLVAAALIGLLGLLSLERRRSFMGATLTVWGVIFVLNGALMAREQIKPWPMIGSEEAAVRVFFSPSCPACRVMLRELVEGGGAVGGMADSRLALYPLDKSEDDVQALWRLQELSATAGAGAVLRELVGGTLGEVPKASSKPDIGFRLRLWSNKIFLLRSGFTTVPVLISTRPVGEIIPWFAPSVPVPAGLREPQADPSASSPSIAIPPMQPEPGGSSEHPVSGGAGSVLDKLGKDAGEQDKGCDFSGKTAEPCD